jgi:hypothetical protein
MAFTSRFSKSKTISWTHHARAKMNFYKLSEARVRRVLNSPKRIEEGVAPKTIAMMQPSSIKTTSGKPASLQFKINRGVTPAKAGTPVSKHWSWNNRTIKDEPWTQEIWVMVEDSRDRRTIISAWRYPGKTKPRSEVSLSKMREEYQSFVEKRDEEDSKKK